MDTSEMPFGCDSSSFKEDLQGFIESLGDPGVPESDFTAQNSMVSHMRTRDDTEEEARDLMERQKRVNVLLAKMRDEGLPFECDACEFRTVMEGYLARHKRLFHPEEEEDTVHQSPKKSRLHCEKCDRSFSKEADYTGHLRAVHKEYGAKFTCEECNFVGNEQGMALHKSERHCPECDFVARKGILANHIRVHHKEKVEKKKKIDCKGKDIHDDLNKDKVTEEDIEYEVGDESPFVPLICEALAGGKKLSVDDICAFISERNPQYEMTMIRWQNSVKLRLARSKRFVNVTVPAYRGRLKKTGLWMLAGDGI